jgi:hypothetical protein
VGIRYFAARFFEKRSSNLIHVGGVGIGNSYDSRVGQTGKLLGKTTAALAATDQSEADLIIGTNDILPPQ